MLNECNLLSRYNHYASKLRNAKKDEIVVRNAQIEAKLQQGFSPNKGTQALARNTVTKAAITGFASLESKVDPKRCPEFSTLFAGFDKYASSYDDQPGFSNQTVHCVGETVS